MFKDLLKLNKALDSLDVHKKHIVAVMVVDKDRGKILLGKRRKDGIWTAPAGKMQGEESLRQCIIREAFEEANLHIKAQSLKDLPIVPLNEGRVCHVFLYNVDSKKLDIHAKNDPDKEIERWEWFDIKGKMPTPMDQPRQISVNNARMKTMGLKKSSNDDPDALLFENTMEQNSAEMASKDNEWLHILKHSLIGLEYTDNPREILLPKHQVLYLSKVDEGFYSGFLRKEDPESGQQGETLMQFTKMTIEVILQILKTKGFLQFANSENHSQVENKEESLLGLADALANFKGDLHIHIEKSNSQLPDLNSILDKNERKSELEQLNAALSKYST